MKNKISLLGVLIAVGSATPFLSQAQNNIGITLNNETAKVDWSTPLNSTAELNAGFIYSDPEGSIADIALSATHANGIHQISLGVKAMAAFSTHRNNSEAIALGGTYKLVLSQQFAVMAKGYYAPTVLSFDGLDRYQELDTRMEFKLMPTAELLAGYRNIQLEYKHQQKLTFENGLYVGAQFRF